MVWVVAPQASADLLVLDRDPLDDAAILAEPHLNVRMVISRGRIHRSDL